MKKKGLGKNKYSFFANLLLCGISMISLYPTIHYRSPISHSSTDIVNKAWEMTGRSMYSAVDTVGARIGTTHGRR